MTACCLSGRSCTGGAGTRGSGGGEGGGGGALSAAFSCTVSRLWLNPRRLIFQLKYRGSAKGGDERGKLRSRAEESMARSEGEICHFRKLWFSLSASIGAAFTTSSSLKSINNWEILEKIKTDLFFFFMKRRLKFTPTLPKS